MEANGGSRADNRVKEERAGKKLKEIAGAR